MQKLECQNGNWPDWERQKPAEEPRIRRPNVVSGDFGRAKLAVSGHSSEGVSGRKKRAELKGIWVAEEGGVQQAGLEVGR